MKQLHRAVARTVAARSLWASGDRVAVAVSGGLDSVVLLDLLLASGGLHRGALSVVTVDHGAREGSAADADFVEALAARSSLPVTRIDLDPPSDPSEVVLRDLRYAAFDTLDVDRVALAHHARDQVETALLGWMRGGGTDAMAGMPWRRGRYVRPMLDQPHTDLVTWATDRGLEWREDPTNLSLRYTRNRVRHEVLPLLAELRDGVEASMARGARHAAADAELLEALSAESERFEGDGWDRSWIAGAPSPLVRRALRRRLGERSSRVWDAVVEAARRGSGVVSLSPSVRVQVEGERVLIVRSYLAP